MKLLDIATAPWAILPDKLEEIQAIYATHMRGEKIDIKALEAKIGRPLDNPDQGYQVVNDVAIVPIHGVMAKRMNMFSQISGGMSTQLASRDLRAAAADPKVRGIILDVDSPGGTVDGTPELGAIVRAVAEQKPTVAFASGTMASAAYWVGSAAQSVFISSGVNMVGSIGVISRHMDISRAQESSGVKTTLIYAGRYKAIANEFEPLSEAGRAEMQSQVDYLYSQFVGAVAQHRGVPVSAVLDGMADGKVFVGEQAIQAGLVDGVSTMEDLIAMLSAGEVPKNAVKNAAKSVNVNFDAATKFVTGHVAGEINKSTGAGVALEPTNHEDSEMDIKQLRAEHPALVEALLKEGRDSVDASALSTAGAVAERSRIQSIHALAAATVGHGNLIAEAMFDGTSCAGDVATKILAADNAARANKLEGLKNDGAVVAAVKPGPANIPSASDDSNLPIEERCKAKWDSDPELRAQNGNLFSAYLAYEKASAGGKVKILGKKTA